MGSTPPYPACSKPGPLRSVPGRSEYLCCWPGRVQYIRPGKDLQIAPATIFRLPSNYPEEADPFCKNVHPIHPALHTVLDRKSTRLNSSHVAISYAVFCLKKKKTYIESTS